MYMIVMVDMVDTVVMAKTVVMADDTYTFEAPLAGTRMSIPCIFCLKNVKKILLAGERSSSFARTEV